MGRHADVVEQGFEAFNRHDFDVMAELCTPDVEWTPPEELPGSRTYHGVDGVREAISDMLDVFPDLQAERVELNEEDDRVVALYRWHGTGGTMGAAIDAVIEVRAGGIFEFEGDLIRRARFWTTWEAALEAAERERARQNAGP